MYNVCVLICSPAADQRGTQTLEIERKKNFTQSNRSGFFAPARCPLCVIPNLFPNRIFDLCVCDVCVCVR